MAEKNVDKDTLKAQKEAEKAAEKAKKERIKQSKPKKEGNVFSRGGAAVKKFCKDFAGTCKKVVWPTGKQVFKNAGVVLATIVVIGIAVGLVDLGLTSVFDLAEDALGELGDKYASEETTVADETTTAGLTTDETTSSQENESSTGEADTSESESAQETVSDESSETTASDAQ